MRFEREEVREVWRVRFETRRGADDVAFEIACDALATAFDADDIVEVKSRN